jgi:hypothetical protein
LLVVAGFGCHLLYGAIDNRPAAAEQGRNRAEALPFLVVQSRGLGALVRA